MPRASAAAAAETARAVLRHASELFTATGFGEVSIEEIAQAAGVTRGAVYHHYGSKAGLFAAVATHVQARVAADVVRVAEAAGPDPIVALRVGSHAFLDAVTAPAAIRILLVDAPAVIGWQRWRRLDAENAGAHLRDALAAAGVGADLLDALTAQLSGAMNEAALQIAEQPDQDTRRRAHAALDLLIDAVVR